MEALDPRDTWERYVLAWKVASAEEKVALLRESTHPDCTYTDPLAQTHDHAALVAYMMSFHEQIPGAHFVTRYFQVHHGRAIAAWDLVDGDGNKLSDGTSFGEFADDGLLRAMTGFYEIPGDAA